MRWYQDEIDDEYDELVYSDDEEDEDEQYFDVPMQYRPISLVLKKGEKMSSQVKEYRENESAVTAIEETQKLCQKLMQTPHYQKMGAEGIFAIVQKARAIGIDPLEALNGGFYYVQGKVELSSAMMNDLIRRQGHSITKDKSSDSTVCILHGKRKDNGDTWCESFSIEDAKLAGIYRNQWLKYPKDMLFARALSRLARQLFPDVIKGCYVDGEISQSAQAEIGPQIDVKVPDLSIQEMKEICENNIEIPEPQYFEEYLLMVKDKVSKPLREVADSWLSNPEPFKNHYIKWVTNKLVAENPSEDYKEII